MKNNIIKNTKQYMQELPIRIRPGYACINASIKENFRNFRLATVEKRDDEKLIDVISHNIRLLNRTIKYNIEHNIYLYRVSSDIIPFCTHPYIVELYNDRILASEEVIKNIQEINVLNKKYNLRLSIHPGQFNVLASPRKEVVERSIQEINAETNLIKSLGGKDVILHVGGSYGDKESAIKRFTENIKYVDTSCLIVENDDKVYSAEDIYKLCEVEKLNWVFDYHHHKCKLSEEYTIENMLKSYPPIKYHLSTGATGSTDRSHAEYISKTDFIALRELLIKANIKEADIMFEAKKKNDSITAILEPVENGYWVLKEV